MDSRIGPETRIEVVTEGVLTRMLQSDPSLQGIGLVIFDEFHERSLMQIWGWPCVSTPRGF
jgi:ATP-dependent helicase HrpB